MEVYIIEKGICAENLKDRVNMRIGDGYEVSGGIAIDADYHYQAMILSERAKEDRCKILFDCPKCGYGKGLKLSFRVCPKCEYKL